MSTPARKTTPSLHATSLWEGEIVEENDFGSMRRVTADNLPILNRLSIKRVLLNPGAMRTPHWHANANELTYCVSGTALVSVLDDGSSFANFIVTAGRMFHVDSGALHHIENIGTDVAEFIITFSSERPEDFGLGATFGAFTDAVLGNTYDLPAADFAKIHRDSRTDRKLVARVGDPEIPASAYFNDPHKFDIEAQTPPLNYATGQARFAGMREPHWHPVTAEMGYVQHGEARMTVMNPDGSLDDLPNFPFTPGRPADRRPRQPCGRQGGGRMAASRYGVCPPAPMTRVAVPAKVTARTAGAPGHETR